MSDKDISPIVAPVSVLCAYFENTESFLIALLLGFVFNIVAGFKADQVKFKMWRLCNFDGNKFKDSLIELLLIVMVTYFLKMLADLMHQADKSSLIVQCLIWVALYYYVRNGLRNLTIAYPENRWIRFVYIVVGLQFKEIAPGSVKKAWFKSEKKLSKKDIKDLENEE